MKRIWGWLVELWREQQRSIDISALWPACKAQCRDLEEARVAFTIHALNDPAWDYLGQDKIVERVWRLS